MTDCIFCNKLDRDIIVENELARAFYDHFPVNEGHVLIVSKRHVESFFDADPQEIDAINKIAFEVKNYLDRKYNPDGYNIGVNIGLAAGQTIFHLHVHVIPRYAGDVDDPRGGVRRVKKSMVPYYPER